MTDYKGNKVWTIPAEVEMVEGESKTFPIVYRNATTIAASPTNKIYNQEDDTSATNLSGTASRSGTTVTTQAVGTVKGGETYILATTATVDGKTLVRLTKIKVVHPWGAS